MSCCTVGHSLLPGLHLLHVVRNIVKFWGRATINRVWIGYWSWDSSDGIATGYGLDDRGVGVRVPVGPRIFSSPRRPDPLWEPTSYPMGTGGDFRESKAACAWRWSLTSN
jgi:hypothetical protein